MKKFVTCAVLCLMAMTAFVSPTGAFYMEDENCVESSDGVYLCMEEPHHLSGHETRTVIGGSIELAEREPLDPEDENNSGEPPAEENNSGEPLVNNNSGEPSSTSYASNYYDDYYDYIVTTFKIANIRLSSNM